MSVGIVALAPGGPVEGSIQPPGSKSLTNRALICSAFASGESTLRGALSSEDTAVMIDSLNKLGVRVEQQSGGRTLVVDSAGRKPCETDSESLFIGNSGTSVRFLTAALSALGGHYRLVGVPRMHQRPIGDLIDALQPVVDGTVVAESPESCPPVIIRSQGWSGHRISVAGSVSSQYLSGLMMAAPIAHKEQRVGRSVSTRPADDGENGVTTIDVQGELVSRPYVEMTAAVMRSFGASVELLDGPEGDTSVVVRIADSSYRGVDYAIEPDASAASYFWAAAAITGGRVTVEGLWPDAMQGDVGFCDVLAKMGCRLETDDRGMTIAGGELSGIDIDMNSISDTVQTLAVVALFARGSTRIRGVAHNRFKETDRIGDLARELRKLGAKIDEHDDGMTITPPDLDQLRGADIETYDDHRMAMSLSLAGLRIPGVRIRNPACTGKTYPEFFADLERLTGRPHLWSHAAD